MTVRLAFFAAALLLAATACSSPSLDPGVVEAAAARAAEAATPPMTLLPASATKLTDALLDALSTPDLAALPALLSDSVVFVDADGITHTGRDRVVALWTGRRAGWRSIEYATRAHLPWKVTRAPEGGQTGTFLAVWATAMVTFTNGQARELPVHMVLSLNEAGTIDRLAYMTDTHTMNTAGQGR